VTSHVNTSVDRHVFLLGRPPISDLLGFIRNFGIEGQDADQGALTAEWRKANDHVRVLEKEEEGLADKVKASPLPSDLLQLAQRVLNDGMFQRAFRFVPSEIAMVPLDRLVVFQKSINLAFVDSLKATLPQKPLPADAMRLAFGLDRPDPPVQMMQNAQNVFTLVSPSNDFRLLEPISIRPETVPNLPTTGRPTALIGLIVGFGSNYLNAMSVDGRLVLNNGSHRAYALRELGFERAPCLVQNVSRQEELELVAAGDFLQNPDRYLKTKRPPLLKDYFDDKLRKIIEVRRKNRLVRLQFGVDQSDVPAA